MKCATNLMWIMSILGTAGIADSSVAMQAAPAGTGAPSCERAAWIPTFGLAPELGTFGPYVRALTVFDDGLGGGPALYVAGSFNTASGETVNHIARWDAASGAWTPLGSGTNGTVWALTVYDNGLGNGPALYAAGEFSTAGGVTAHRIARWNARTGTWSPIGSGMNGTVYALTVFDDGAGDGPTLYAGGQFTVAGGVLANRIAKLTPRSATWSKVGQGFDNRVYALTVFDDGLGGGPALHAGGLFTTSDRIPVNRIARWNPATGTWSPLGGGMDNSVWALTTFDDGSGGGPALYAGGTFTSAGGATANRIARWNAASGTWSPLGSGMNDSVWALAVFDDGSEGGSALCAGGDFTSCGAVTANRIARWNAATETWSPLGSGVNDTVLALAVFDDGMGDGAVLHAGGDFIYAESSVSGTARWNAASGSWLPMGHAVNDDVTALTVFDDGLGAGPALYAGGRFTAAGGVSAKRIARWNAATESWSPLGSGMGGGSTSSIYAPSVYALTVLDDGLGEGPALYAGGGFTTAGGVSANRVARWHADTGTWSPLGSGVEGGADPRVYFLTTFDDGLGGGPALYAGGDFTTAGGVTVNRIARWNAASETWSPLASGMSGSVRALTVFDDGLGGGPALYAGGDFTTAGGVTVNRIARWNAATETWSPLGSGMSTIRVNALATFDDGLGGGAALYAGGLFMTAGGVTVNCIARWNAASGTWSPLGSGMPYAVYALAVFDDGSGDGSALYAGGLFSSAGGVKVNNVARWDASSGAWSALGDGAASSVFTFAVLDDGLDGATALFAGGAFTVLPAGDSHVAKWGCVEWTPPCAAADLNCDGTVDGNDLAIILGGWGPCEPPPCLADINDDGVVDGNDLAIVLGAWGVGD